MFSFVYRHRVWLIAFYLVGAGFFLIATQSVFNGGLSFSVRILWFPLALLIFGFTWLNRRFFYAMQSRWKTWLAALAWYPVSLLLTWPYVMALNAATSTGDRMAYSGPIQRKWILREEESLTRLMYWIRQPRTWLRSSFSPRNIIR